MNGNTTGARAGDDPVARYEELRQHALSVGKGAGLLLLLRQGMKAWLEASHQSANQAVPPAPVGSGGTATIMPELRSEAVFVLAGMALGSRREAKGK